MHPQPLTAEEFTRNSLRMRNLPANSRQLQQTKEFPQWGGWGGQPTIGSAAASAP